MLSFNRDFFVGKCRTFVLLTLSSLGFSLGLVLVRLFGDEAMLPKVLSFQSTVVLLSFILQLGSRAALRVHFYGYRHRLVGISEDFVYLLQIPLAILGVVYVVYFNGQIYLATSCALALTTLRLTLSVARESPREQLIYSSANFLLCLSGSILFLLESDYLDADVLIEVLSLLVIVLSYKKIHIPTVLRRRKAIYLILYKAQSYQLGSGVVALMVFVLTQSMILIYENTTTIVAYADVQIASGFLTLFLGQTLLMFEARLYKDSAARIKVFGCMLLLHVSTVCLFSLLVSSLYQVGFSVVFVASFILSSRVTLGFITQYTVLGRRWLNAFFVSAAIFYSAYYLFFLKTFVGAQLVPVMLFIILGCGLFWREKKYAE